MKTWNSLNYKMLLKPMDGISLFQCKVIIPCYIVKMTRVKRLLQKHGIGLIPWSPNAGGMLCRPFDSDKNKQFLENKQWANIFGLGNVNDSDKAIVDRVEELSVKYNVSMMQVSLAWLIAKGVVPLPVYLNWLMLKN